ncbi:cold shock domain-containing protein [Flavobacterium agricola]|uniref:Cold shock domain-containing protein n=1 Tax=Flavobacterium agricola TaxID=2870839 RepID=A0ABY6M1S6_9FLAO|nr:cold shock domain-containing protein [Flavobacterium agricola]UYW02495.1 cold shock domain-containing protein [Flavobacterium agricola]
MADSFSKKEFNKKKAKKKADKLNKREDRKVNNNKGKSLEEMFIYVDANGNLTETPPHLQAEVKEEIKLNPNEIFEGRVSYFSDKGYGFIIENNSKEDIFFHYLNLVEPVAKNDKVTFTKQDTPKGFRAINIKKII